jgi:colanic acid/amylovoran biosynthesis glycosyltransferase
MIVGMFIPEFPTQTHIFFWREVEALRQVGVSVHLLSTKRPVDSCPHDFAQTAVKQTHYVYPPRLLSILGLLSSPLGLAKSARYIFSLTGGFRAKIKAFGYLLCAADLKDFATKHGLNHIHVHSCSDAAHIAAMERLLGGPRYSLHLHGDLAVYGRDHAQKAANAEFVAAAARTMQQQLIDIAGIPEPRTHTMWMGVDTSRFTQHSTRSSGVTFHLVSVGRLHLCKGHRYTLQAIKLLKESGVNVVYTIAGSGPHLKEVELAITEAGLIDQVHLVGSLGELEVRDLLNTADAFVLSSVGVGEASPVAVMEAMAAGVPVISSIIGGTPDMINNEIDGLLVAQEDVNGIANAIRRLHDDSAFGKKLGSAARDRAVKQFDYHATSQKLLNAISASAKLNDSPLSNYPR